MTSLQATLGLSDNCDYELLAAYIREATDFVEMLYSVAVMTQRWTITADGWFDQRHYRPVEYGYGYIAIERPPFASIVKVDYIDGDQVSQEWTDYHLVTGGMRAKLQPRQDKNWPADIVANQLGSVTIEFICGVATQEEVPPGVARTIRDVAQHRYEHDCLPTKEWMDALTCQMTGYAAGVYS